MKRLVPASVTGRVILALFAVILLINLASLLSYIVFRDGAAVAAAAAQAADQIIGINRMIERTPATDQRALIHSFTSPTMSLAITRGNPIVEASDTSLASRVVMGRLKEGLRDELKNTDIRVDSRIALGGFQAEANAIDEEVRQPFTNNMPLRPPIYTRNQSMLSSMMRAWHRFFRHRIHEQGTEADAPNDLDEALFRVSIMLYPGNQQIPEGERGHQSVWLNAQVLLNVGQSEQYAPFLGLTAICVVIGLIAFWGVRRALVPLSIFAAAAERLGVDFNVDPLSEKGPSEVHRAARAFNTMQTRLKRFIHDRTQMLAAISHDLRTPITRLRLRAEFIDDDAQRTKMLNDLDEMEAMISTTLVFARDDAANEPAVHVDAAAIIANLCGDLQATGREVLYSGPDSLDLLVRPLAFKRAINNFIDNAVKYGKAAHVTLVPGGEDAIIWIDDQGPGIPKGDAERVFAPFTRLESSRSRETGGTGLGLTIARNAIRGMGGDVTLVNRAEGGLRVTVSLPMAHPKLLEAAE